jgi:hypothetical protein
MGKTFDLGKIVVTHKTLNAVGLDDIVVALRDHLNNCRGCYNCNRLDAAVDTGKEETSYYKSHDNQEFLVTTKADRTETIVILEEDYYYGLS